MSNTGNPKCGCGKCGDGDGPTGEIKGMKAIMLPLYDKDGNKNSIDLSDPKIDEIMKEHGLNMDNSYPLPEPYIDEDGKKWYPQTVHITLKPGNK